MRENNLFRSLMNRVLQHVARFGPGARSFRVYCHRLRGVKIQEPIWIGYDAVIETSFPQLVSIGRNTELMAGVMIIAHMEGSEGVVIGDNVYIGPRSIILPNVRIGDGSVVTAGSVVNRLVPPGTMVQGNPAKPIAKCGIPLVGNVRLSEFQKNLRPIRRVRPRQPDVSGHEGK